MRIKIVMTLPRVAVSVSLARRTVAEALRSALVARDCVEEAEIALSEACTNVYRHAGVGDHYEVVITIADEQLTIDILDSGAGIANHDRNPTMPDGNAENGRGLSLMAAFSDRTVFDGVAGNGSSVHLIKKLRWDHDRTTPEAANAD